MGVRIFDRKFGADLLRDLPEAPAVYLFRDESGAVLYAGKARNVRRRLQGYRNASRRKAHRKMRKLVRAASSLEVRLQASERDALLAENQLIRELRPPYNVDGAYAFLYPAIGLGSRDQQMLLAFTSRPEAWRSLRLRWYGSFRSRRRAREGFDALAALLGRVGHVEPRSRLPKVPGSRGSRLLAVRRLPPEWLRETRSFLSGDSPELPRRLCERLLESSAARQDAALVQDDLRRLDDFWETDVLPLRDALEATGSRVRFVPQEERDALFIRAGSEPSDDSG